MKSNYLLLSSGHITQGLFDTSGDSGSGYRILGNLDEVFFHVPPYDWEEEDWIDPILLRIFRYARYHGCTLLHFRYNAPIIQELEYFDWEYS